jgi:SAM-dependent methyltransferase
MAAPVFRGGPVKATRLKSWQSGRIFYYQDHANARFWDGYWRDSITREYYARFEKGELEEFARYFEKYLRKEDRILEAGCGAARYIVALRARGFQHIEGVEWGQETVKNVKKIYPGLPVRVGDVTRLDTPEDYYDAYISLGVVEHRAAGPEPFLEEAFRVLKPGGVAIFSVPYVNPLRYLKARLGAYRIEDTSDRIFYQYAFPKSVFSSYLIGHGFEILESHGVAGYYGLNEELPGLFKFLDRVRGGWTVRQYLKKAGWVDLFGHTVVFICAKPVRAEKSDGAR